MSRAQPCLQHVKEPLRTRTQNRTRGRTCEGQSCRCAQGFPEALSRAPRWCEGQGWGRGLGKEGFGAVSPGPLRPHRVKVGEAGEGVLGRHAGPGRNGELRGRKWVGSRAGACSCAQQTREYAGPGQGTQGRVQGLGASELDRRPSVKVCGEGGDGDGASLKGAGRAAGDDIVWVGEVTTMRSGCCRPPGRGGGGSPVVVVFRFRASASMRLSHCGSVPPETTTVSLYCGRRDPQLPLRESWPSWQGVSFADVFRDAPRSVGVQPVPPRGWCCADAGGRGRWHSQLSVGPFCPMKRLLTSAKSSTSFPLSEPPFSEQRLH